MGLDRVTRTLREMDHTVYVGATSERGGSRQPVMLPVNARQTW